MCPAGYTRNGHAGLCCEHRISIGAIMKSLLTGIALVALSAGASVAADMPAPVLKAPPAVVINSWSGFYLGATAGARATDHDLNITAIDEVFAGGSVQHNFPICTTNITPCGSGA